MGKKNNIIIF